MLDEDPGNLSQSASSTLSHRALRTEKSWGRIFDPIPQFIIVLSPDGKAIYANRVALEYTGCP